MAGVARIGFMFLLLRAPGLVTSDSGGVVTSRNVLLKEGEPGELPCTYPRPASLLFWTKGNTVAEAAIVVSTNIPRTGHISGPGALDGRFDLSEFSLVISSVKKEDAGRYFCEITDESTGDVFRNHTDVTVSDTISPSPAVVSVSTVAAVELTEETMGVLPCHFPQPVSTVYWKEGDNIEDATDVIILDLSYGGHGELSGPGYNSGQFVIQEDFSLVIKAVDKENAGRYFCEVVGLGTTSRYHNYTDVTVIDHPSFYIDQCKDISRNKDNGVCIVEVPSTQGDISVDCSVIAAKGHISITWSSNDTVSRILSTTSINNDNVGNLTATIREQVANIPEGRSFTCAADVNNGVYTWKFTFIPELQTLSAEVISEDWSAGMVIVAIVVPVIVVGVILIIFIKTFNRHQTKDEDPEPLMQGQTDPYDESLPSWATNTSQRVRIRGKKKTKSPPITIQRRFQKIKDKYPTRVALAVKDSLDDEHWREWTYEEYWNDCRKVAKALLELRIQRHQTIGICGRNSPEWVLSYMGTIMAGCVAVGLSTYFSKEQFWQVVDDSKPEVIVMEDTDENREISEEQGGREYPKHFVFYNPQQDNTESPDQAASDYSVISWETFIELGRGIPDEQLDSIIQEQTPNECCSITYPWNYPTDDSANWKGCMISHDNLTWLSRQCFIHCGNILQGTVRIASCLSLHHVAFQLIYIMVPLTAAGATYFVRNLDDSPMLIDFVKLVRPTIFVFVPHVLEKMKEKIIQKENSLSDFRRRLVNWSKQIGLRGHMNTPHWKPKPWGWTLANILLFRKVRNELGLNECKCCFSSGNKIVKATLDFFLSLDLPIYELYGMAESAGALTSCMPRDVRFGSVGKTLTTSKVVIHNPDTAGNGEVCFYNRNLFMGYLNQEERTNDVLTERGLFLTGDIGHRDSDGFLYIIGKTRDKIETSSGATVHPGSVERAMKNTSVISNCMVVGTNRPYLTLLATPTHLKEKQKGGNGETEAMLGEDYEDSIKSTIKHAIEDYNTSVVSSKRHIRKCFLLDKEFSTEDELTGVLRRKIRNNILKNYEAEIEVMYRDDVQKLVGVQILTRKDQDTTVADAEETDC